LEILGTAFSRVKFIARAFAAGRLIHGGYDLAAAICEMKVNQKIGGGREALLFGTALEDCCSEACKMALTDVAQRQMLL
jgi:hypothetical protein